MMTEAAEAMEGESNDGAISSTASNANATADEFEQEYKNLNKYVMPI